MTKLVCVTGATGYVGSYVVKELLARGYRVRATVRDPSDKKKAAHLLALPGATERLELAAGDLEREGSFDEALKGSSYLIHTASAVTLAAKDPQREIVDVAVNGAKNVVRAAIASGTNRRIVMTSSVAAVAGEDRPTSHTFSEDDWNDTATVQKDAYGTSKVQAERAARELARGKIELVTTLPSLVLGPVMTEQHLRTSPAVLFELMRGAWPGVPDLHFQTIDVRDLATAHVRAMEIERPAERYLCSSDAAGLRLMAAELRCAFPDTKVPSMALPDVLMYATALFDKRLTFGFLKRNLGHAPRFDNRRMRTELGVEPWSVRDSVIDTGESIVMGGYLSKKS